jgi:hypothetical protein
MTEEYKPRQEVIDFFLSGKNIDQGIAIIDGHGGKKYTLRKIVEEAKAGTAFGRRQYRVMEKMYDEVQARKESKKEIIPTRNKFVNFRFPS